MSNFSQQQLNLLIATIANGKMIDELDEQVTITSSSTTFAINDGTDNAKKVTVEKARGLLGDWNASLNSPTLTNGIGVGGDRYNVSVAGTVNFGDGNINFKVGDDVLYSGGVWKKRAKADSTLIVQQDQEMIVKRGGNTGNILEIGDRVWFKQVDDSGTTITLAGQTYNGGDPLLYASYSQDGIGETVDL